MPRRILFLAAALACAGAAVSRAEDETAKRALTRRLWPPERIGAAVRAVEAQRAAGLLSDTAYEKRMAMLRRRLAGTYVSRSLSVTDPPLNFVQNGGFELVNRNSAPNRSRWLWWGGWSWGGEYENMWEERPEHVHGGKHSARIRCVGRPGRIGIMTPKLPKVPGATVYRLTFWAQGEGDNMLFVNFESGARGTLRERIGPEWKQYTAVGKPESDTPTYSVFFYHTGSGTIWLDDVRLVPVSGANDATTGTSPEEGGDGR